ncbi:site-specific DNA-methyltransferase [Gracilimonas sediminicola]|uniref:site-specific DNA-methyltransferase n=1 Tax=Gracilimonas sediminicola TaxID=2952158 RepID=UPI0038D3F5D6
MSDTITPLKEKDGESKDLVAENIEKLKQLFPEIVTDGKVDFETLEEVLGDFKEDSQERYSFKWNGKSKARKLAMTPSRGTLRPVPEESVNWDSTENLFIEGDNLEVLKLLQRSYHRKIKLIYIDPPYNTGNDFVYNDDYKNNLTNYLSLTGQLDKEGKKVTSNPEYSGRYHTDWLNMMFPRLMLARELLVDDGAIFISIDDNEHSNLIKLCNEVFGEENFLANVVWKHTQQSKNDEPHFSRQYNHLVCYRKSDKLDYWRLPRTKKDNKNYSNPDNDPNGAWRSGDVRSPNLRKTLKYDLITPSGKKISPPENGWRWSESTVKEKIETGEIVFNDDETKITRKIYLKDQEGRVPENLWDGDRFGTTRTANTTIKRLFDDKVPFDTPKPIELIKRMIDLVKDDKDAIILDFFAGSSSTAHSVMDYNVSDPGNRKFIMVQLPEKCDKNSIAYKLGFDTIADISKERIRRAGKSLESDTQTEGSDFGFKVFKLHTSNIKLWDPTFDEVQLSIEDSIENIKPDRTEQDVLYEILLKYGLDLSLPIEEKEIAGSKVFVAGAGALFICLAPNIDLEVVEGISKLKDELEPELTRVVFRDSGFKDDVVKTNAVQILKQHGIEDVRSI